MKRAVLCLIAPLTLAGTVVRAADRDDVLAVVTKYIQYEESGDMLAQGDLMTKDRSMVYVGGRLTGDNRKLMQEQQDEEDRHKQQFPGVHYKVAIKDVQVQLYNGDSSLVTLDWYPTRVVPASLAPEQVRNLEAAKTPLIVALMLVKHDGAWKIAFSSFVPREKS